MSDEWNHAVCNLKDLLLPLSIMHLRISHVSKVHSFIAMDVVYPLSFIVLLKGIIALCSKTKLGNLNTF